MNGERMFFLLMLFFIALDTESCFSKPISKTLPTKMESSIRWPSNVHRQLLQPNDLDCDSRTGSWHTCMLMGCGVNVETDLFTLVTSTSCSYDQTREMWGCGNIAVDSLTYETLKKGECTQSCSPQQLQCTIFSRFETKHRVPIISSECQDGSVTMNFKCDCRIVTRDRMIEYTQGLDGSQGGCSAVCSESDRDLSKCVVPAANSQTQEENEECQDQICLYRDCAAQITRQAVDIVIESTCTFSVVSRLWSCGEDLEIDDPGYNWAKFGNCVDACSIKFTPGSCLFKARYGRHPKPEKDENKGKNKYTGELKRSKIPTKDEPKKKEKDKEASKGKVRKDKEPHPKPEKERPPMMNTTLVKKETLPMLNSTVESNKTSEAKASKKASTRGKLPDSINVVKIDSIPSENITIPNVTTSQNSSASIPQYTKPSTTRVEAEEPSESNKETEEPEIYASPWLPCEPSCTDPENRSSVRERFVLCRSAQTGLPISRDQCKLIEKEPSVEACKNDDICHGRFVAELTDWSQCSIDPKNEQKCRRHRDYDCFERLKDGSWFPTDKRHCKSTVQDPLELPCDPRQCYQLVYLFSEWSPCDCDRSIQTRNLTCSSVIDADRPVNASLCESLGIPKPETTRNCTCDINRRRQLRQMPTSCAGRTCSDNGSCREGVCVCDPSFEGVDCEHTKNITFIEDPTCIGNVVIDEKCCESGIYDRNYQCCDKDSTLDRDGFCCNGKIDACGVCNGKGRFVDAYGHCCNTVLDANGFCCASENVDECGVCDGFGMTCDFKLEFSFPPKKTITYDCVETLMGETLRLKKEAANATLLHAIEEEKLSVWVPGSLIEFDRTTSALDHTVKRQLDRLYRGFVECDRAEFRLEVVDRQSVYKNGHCEVGESIFLESMNFDGLVSSSIDWRGIDDCSFIFAKCPTTIGGKGTIGDPSRSCSGNGVCAFAGLATCSCFEGYTGPACDQCDRGYSFRKGRCLANQIASLNNPNRPASIKGSEEREPSNAPNHIELVLILLVALTFGVVCALFVCMIRPGCTKYSTLVPTPTEDFGRRPEWSDFDRSHGSFSGGEDITVAGSTKTTSSGTPIALKIEPEEVNATPNRRITDVVDGSNFHGNVLHRPLLSVSSSSRSMSYPYSSVIQGTVDIAGEKRPTRRMASPDGSPLFPIQEGSSVSFDNDSLVGQSRRDLHSRKSSKSLDSSSSSALHSFERWLDSAEMEPTRSPRNIDSPRVDVSDVATTSSSRSNTVRRQSGATWSMSSFEFDQLSPTRDRAQTSEGSVLPNPLQPSETRLNLRQRWCSFVGYPIDSRPSSISLLSNSPTHLSDDPFSDSRPSSARKRHMSS